ncbi:MAG TPA: TRAP transporter substrate-binding protein [Devosia sp.]|jgi:tripartite ATP-independent transporter DctP family solute receptor|uniref:TRAP transporter substrate-binding protein n=1 Tax=Devosia sp. TaxID=1871048 RepID=UPI002DDD9733|nr:TRAP transporter substrate-binding protein [Devosia sp.]HEV2514172.1 TRAP transporter substrate-binding protein [Devosia sp.]
MFQVTKLAATAMVAAAMMIGGAAAQTVLVASDTHPDGYPTVEAVKYFGQLVSERTAGRYSVDVKFGAQLGQEADTVEQVRAGAIAINRTSLGPWNGLVKQTIVPSLPYIFKSTAHARSVMSGPVGDEILAAFEPYGVIGLAFYDGGARSFYTSDKQITSVADLKGMKLRTMQSDIFVDMMAAFGATATPMPYGEVYSAIETGVVDGAENNFPSYDTAKHSEVAKFYTLDEHLIVPEVLVISKMVWDGISPEDQAVIRQAAKDSVARQYELWDAKVAESRKIVEGSGSTIVEVADKQAFVDAVKPVYDKYAADPELKALIEKIQAAE